MGWNSRKLYDVMVAAIMHAKLEPAKRGVVVVPSEAQRNRILEQWGDKMPDNLEVIVSHPTPEDT